MGVRITGIAEEGTGARKRADSAVAMALNVSLGQARAYLDALPQVWPSYLDASELGLVEEPCEEPARGRCEAHGRLLAHAACVDCDAPLCAVCAVEEPPRCRGCVGKKRGRRRFFLARVTFLLGVLAVVLVYAGWDVHRRRQRTTWQEPLDVAIVVVPRGPIDPGLIDVMRARTGRLQDVLGEEQRRHAAGAGEPFVLSLHALDGVAGLPPPLPEDGLLGLAEYTWDKRTYLGAIDERVGLSRRGFDAVIYLLVTPAVGSLRTVEGMGEEGGSIGLVEIDLDASTVDLALFVAVHELLHLLGADDLYAPGGAVQVPQGLAEPHLEPLYPQRYTEVMARHRALSETEGALPESIEELRIGEVTAAAIGWR